ncbi:MAG: ABC transporter permease [Patescibacteria group bacterium]|jgi:ABC-type antimicrobial peptide transport system permease subunit
MNFFDYIRLAIRNLSRQKSRTFLTIMATTVGSLSLILMISILISVRQSLMDSFSAMGAFNLVTLVQDADNLENVSLISSGNWNTDSGAKKIDDTTLIEVKKIAHVESATPTMGAWVKKIKLDGFDKKSQESSLLGYLPDSSVFDLPLLAGRKLQNEDLDKIVVGGYFTSYYGFNSNPKDLIGKKVSLYMQGNYPDWGEKPPVPPQGADKSWWDDQQNKDIIVAAEIVGVVDNGAMDDKQNYISMDWVKRLTTSVRWENDETAMKACQEQQRYSNDKSNNNGDICSESSEMKLVKDSNSYDRNGYGSIIMKIDNKDNSKAVGEQITKMGYGAVTAESMVAKINQIFTMVSIILGVIGGISLFVAAIGIINTMVMATFERIREIGVMRACGATRAAIRRLFTFEAAMLGFWGGVFGLSISFGLVRLAKILVTKYGADLGNIPVDNIGNFPWWLVLGAISFTTLVGLLSGLGPAIKAARMNPVDALRYE